MLEIFQRISCLAQIKWKYLQFKTDWLNKINASNGPSGRGRNKLRTYCTFKQDYGVEKYCKYIMPKNHRSALCKFRCGVAPLRIETGRYEGLFTYWQAYLSLL